MDQSHDAQEFPCLVQRRASFSLPTRRGLVDAVLFPESAPFVTGETLHIDGGKIAGH